MKIPDYPTVDYPTILEGRVYGDRLRIESLSREATFLLPTDIAQITGVEHNGDCFILTNAGPFIIDFRGETKTWGISHQQKFSRYGYLRVSPSCYHRWAFIRRQKQDAAGNWIPGTEVGIYFRMPFSWRWDVAGTLVNGVLRHWIWTKGFLGGHWD